MITNATDGQLLTQQLNSRIIKAVKMHEVNIELLPAVIGYHRYVEDFVRAQSPPENYRA